MENILYERNVLEGIDRALELAKITFLLGSRQTGKTSLMKLTLDRFSNRGYTCFHFMEVRSSLSPKYQQYFYKRKSAGQKIKGKK